MPRYRSWAVLLLALLGTGCATGRVVRLDTGDGRTQVFTPRTEVEPPSLDGGAFQSAVRELSGTVPVSARPRAAVLRLFGLPEVRGRLGLVSVDGPRRGRLRLLPESGTELERAYGQWCLRKKEGRDCLHLLERGATLDEEGKRTLAFRLGLDVVWDETEAALREMTDPEAVASMLVTTGVIYFGLWLVPEPLLSKGIAVTLTVALIGYLGWDTVWSLVEGWRVLATEVAAATTFEEVRAAGEKFGAVMGRKAARAFVMLAMAALGSSAELLATRIATLPGSGQAALVAAAQTGVRLGAVSQVDTVVVTSGGAMSIELAPGAVAMAAQEASGAAAAGVVALGPDHHIATNKNSDSDVRGGPWTPRFKAIFDRAGMSLNDPANLVKVPGHKGPHPQAYHEEVYQRLERATRNATTQEQCRVALTRALQKLAREILTVGSELNRWVTMSE